jgi:hypothetical protein
LGPNSSSSTLCSQKPSVYIPSSKWETKLRTHIYYTHTKSNLNFSNSTTTDLIVPTLETPNVPNTKSHVLSQLLSSCQRINPGPRHFETFRNKINFYGEVLLAPRPTPKL